MRTYVLLLLLLTLCSHTTDAKPPRLVIFDVHGVLLKETIDAYVSELVHEKLLALNAPINKSFKRGRHLKNTVSCLKSINPLKA